MTTDLATSRPAATAASPSGGVQAVERRSLRVAYVPDRVELVLRGPSSSEKAILTSGLNISRGGVALMLEQPLDAGARCEVSLPTLAGDVYRASGNIRGCIRICGEYYEAGITLDSPIDLTTFVELTAEQRLIYNREQCEASRLQINTADALDTNNAADATDDHDPIFSESIDQPSLRPLIREYLSELTHCVDRLHAAAKDGDCVTLGRLAMWVHGSADAFGFPTLTAEANELLHQVERYKGERPGNQESEEINQAVQRFTAMLQRACRSAA